MTPTSKIIGATAAAAIGIGIGTIAYFGLKRANESEDFYRAYDQALIQYADKNKDGFVTAVERDNFDRDLLRDKNVTLIVGQMPKYQNGDYVPITTVTEWIKEYKPAELER